MFETYSKKKKRLSNAGKTDVYKFDELPNPLRVQIVHIWGDAIGMFSELARISHHCADFLWLEK